MERISPLEYYMTSVTLRAVSVRRVRAVRRLLQRHGLKFSESRLSEELLRLYLRHWRGIGKKPATLRRYNIDGKDYQIRPLYINRVLHAAATQRALHTGESLSRMLDVAVRVYARRLLESVLSSHGQVDRHIREIWNKKYARRRLRDAYFISYEGETLENRGSTLSWMSKAHLIPKKGLRADEILARMRDSA